MHEAVQASVADNKASKHSMNLFGMFTIVSILYASREKGSFEWHCLRWLLTLDQSDTTVRRNDWFFKISEESLA